MSASRRANSRLHSNRTSIRASTRRWRGWPKTWSFGTLSIYNDLWFQPPLVPLILAAQATTRIRLGAASYNPWTLHPVEIAGQVAQARSGQRRAGVLGHLARGVA